MLLARCTRRPACSRHRQRRDAPGADQRIRHQSNRGSSGNARFAITTHSEDDVGVCFKNYFDYTVSSVNAVGESRVVDLDLDISVDAVEYNAIANKQSLSVLETEMRKVDGVVKEIVDEMEYLKRRELRFHSTNGTWEIMHLRAFFTRQYLIDYS
ncbi:hypothetical protein EXIGLDRAFT_734773, partial [Exidia glandulosa HHB12029]